MLWNALHNDIKLAQSTDTFKRLLKNHLFKVADCWHLRMTFVMLLRTSRRRRTKSPCMYTVTATVASRPGLYLRSLIQRSNLKKYQICSFVQRSMPQGLLRQLFWWLISWHRSIFTKDDIELAKSSSLCIRHTHDGNENRRSLSGTEAELQRTFAGQLFQTTTPAPITEAFVSG